MKGGSERDRRSGTAPGGKAGGGDRGGTSPNRDETPSRSARKRESLALQKMGERLVELSEEQLARIPLPEELTSAVLLARRIHERGGRRRQLQYIGRLMRGIDAHAIGESLAAIDSDHRHEAGAHHFAEQWRDRLLREGATSIDALAEVRPGVDRTRVAALLRDVVAERSAGRPPRAARLLYRYLRDVTSSEV